MRYWIDTEPMTTDTFTDRRVLIGLGFLTIVEWNDNILEFQADLLIVIISLPVRGYYPI